MKNKKIQINEELALTQNWPQLVSFTNNFTNKLWAKIPDLQWWEHGGKHHQLWLVAAITIIAIGTWLRTWQLNNLGIFFPDAARDLIVAWQTANGNGIPLLGIPSSVPRFHQGPFNIWLASLLIWSTGQMNLTVIATLFAILNSLSLVFLYELLVTKLSKPAALVGTWLAAISPMAVAVARVPYHTTLLPLVTVFYIYSLIWTVNKRRWGFLSLGFATAIMFGHELAMIGLFGIPIIITLIDKSTRQKNNILQLVLGVFSGLLPFVIYDIFNQGQQLFMFAVWLAYRLASFVGIWQEHMVSPSKLSNYWQATSTNISLVFSVTGSWPFYLVLLVLLLATVLIGKKIISSKNLQKWPAADQLGLAVLLSTIVLLVSFVVHSQPSQASFPPFVILLPIIIAYLLDKLKNNLLYLCCILLMLFGGWQINLIWQNNFFVDTNLTFNFGWSTATQKELWHTANLYANSQTLVIPNEPNDELRWQWWQLEQAHKTNKQEKKIEENNSAKAITIVKPNQGDKFINTTTVETKWGNIVIW